MHLKITITKQILKIGLQILIITIINLKNRPITQHNNTTTNATKILPIPLANNAPQPQPPPPTFVPLHPPPHPLAVPGVPGVPIPYSYGPGVPIPPVHGVPGVPHPAHISYTHYNPQIYYMHTTYMGAYTHPHPPQPPHTSNKSNKKTLNPKIIKKQRIDNVCNYMFPFL